MISDDSNIDLDEDDVMLQGECKRSSHAHRRQAERGYRLQEPWRQARDPQPSRPS